MKRYILALAAGVVFSAIPPLEAEKFPSSLSSTDSLTQDPATSLKQKSRTLPAIQPAPATDITRQPSGAFSWNPSGAAPEDIQKPIAGNLPSFSATAPLKTTPPPLSSTSIPRQTRISVPDFEKKFKEMMQAQQAEKLKKKKTLWESIFDEVTKYGYLMVLGIVIFIVIAALRKEKAPPQPIGTKTPEAPKDIWKEDF